ncbi:SDR family NAD(P)-dependent oxidoreductase [Bradymonadaceae bacterium TMQ3]|nr:SDR family NAD(P)-dependent oxidoreductase [Bradymonadaceae bacterium TMQ3]TXC74539.1 SDR family oxidoreductase [Bradymonadales bacterium TMQ1]
MDDLKKKLDAASALMEQIIEDRGLLANIDEPTQRRFLIAAGRVSHPSKHARRALARARQRDKRDRERDEDQALMDQTGIRQLRDKPIFETPKRRAEFEGTPHQLPEPFELVRTEPIGHTHQERICYVCRESFGQVHHFYDQMCLSCGDFNFAKRSQTADLHGRVALITGARVKIGYQAAIMLLRAGARVIALTRFPNDAARRYAAEADFDDWKHRLEIYGLDLRHTPGVEVFCRHLNQHLPRLDFIVNNACQTVRRPSGFYDHLMQGELHGEGVPDTARQLVGRVEVANNADGATLTRPGASSALLSQVELLDEDAERGHHLFPKGQLDADLQQVDLRKVNSWRLKLQEVSAVELLEVQLVNAVAPFILNARLKPLMEAVPTRDKHIVNVSAMEGQFYRIFKTDRHPHTNMAKAALNMMTRTSATDYIESGIHMNSVDTGWVTDEDPADHARAKREMHRFHPPLDIVDGAARIIDPIFNGINTGDHVWGLFLKDYKPTDW